MEIMEAFPFRPFRGKAENVVPLPPAEMPAVPAIPFRLAGADAPMSQRPCAPFSPMLENAGSAAIIEENPCPEQAGHPETPTPLTRP